MNTKKTVLCFGVAFVILFALFLGLFGVLLNEFTPHNASEWIDEASAVQSSFTAETSKSDIAKAGTVNVNVEIYVRGTTTHEKLYPTYQCAANSTLDLSYNSDLARTVRGFVGNFHSWPSSVWDGFYPAKDSGGKLMSYNVGTSDVTLYAYYDVNPAIGLIATKGVRFNMSGDYAIAYISGDSIDLQAWESELVLDEGYSFVCWSTNVTITGKLSSTVIPRSDAGKVFYAVALPDVSVVFDIYCEGTEANTTFEKKCAALTEFDLSLDGDIAQEIKSYVAKHMTWPKSSLEGFYAENGEKISSAVIPPSSDSVRIKVKYVQSTSYVTLVMTAGQFLYGGSTNKGYFEGNSSIDLKSWEGSTMVIPEGYTFICWSSTPQYSGKLSDTVIPSSAEGNTYYAVVLPDVTLSIDVFCRDDVASANPKMTFPAYSTVDLSDDGEVRSFVQSIVSRVMKWPQSVWDGFYSSRDGAKITSFVFGENDATICAAYKVKPYFTYWYLGADGFSWYDERVYYHDADEVIDMSVAGYSGYKAAEALGIELLGFSDKFAGAVDDDNMFGQEYVYTTLYACYSCTVDIGFVSAKKGVDGTTMLTNTGSGAEIAPRQTYSGQYITLPQSVQEYIAKCIASGKCDRVEPKLIDSFVLYIFTDALQYSGNLRLYDMLAPTSDMQIPTVTVFSFQKFLQYVYKYGQNVNPEFDEQLDLTTCNVVLVPTSGGSVVFDDDGDGVPNKTTGDKISDWFGNLWNGIKESTVFQKAKVAIMIVLGVLAVLLILPLIPYLIQAVIFVVMLPIKAIRAIAKAVKKNKQ